MKINHGKKKKFSIYIWGKTAHKLSVTRTRTYHLVCVESETVLYGLCSKRDSGIFKDIVTKLSITESRARSGFH